MAIESGYLYIGGDFNTVDGLSRIRIARFDLTTGLVDPAWHPGGVGANASIHALAITPDRKLEIGGEFTNFGSFARTYFAEWDLSGDAITSISGTFTGSYVDAITTDATYVYIGGMFTYAWGSSRNGLVAVNRSNNTMAALNSGANYLIAGASVKALAVSGSTLYVGGFLTMTGGYNRTNAVAFDTSTNIPTAWDPQANGNVNTILLTGGSVVLGGNFNALNIAPAVSRRNVAEVDLLTGVATSFTTPTELISGPVTVYTIAKLPSSPYAMIGGNFWSSDPGPLSNAVIFDVTTGRVPE
jgi:hypothetical protein